MPIICDIQVRISCIRIDDKYFSFNYQVKVNGKQFRKDKYSSRHVWVNEKKEFRRILDDGYAVELAMQSSF